MKILVICQHYWPEPYRLPSLCESGVERGHHVHVITDVPNYPMGQIFPEYKKGKRRIEWRRGVKITRVFTIGRRQNIFFRFLNYMSYIMAGRSAVKKLDASYDVVLAYQTSPVLMAAPAITYQKLFGKPLLLYCLDIWPAVLAVAGFSKKGILFRIFHAISKYIYRSADQLAVSSKGFIDYMYQQFDIPPSSIHYIPKYSDATFKTLQPNIKSIQSQEKQSLHFLFAGNIGIAQSIPTILRSAKLLEDDGLVTFHFVGDGSELANCVKLAKKLKLNNVIFHGRVAAENMIPYYEMADALVVSLCGQRELSLTLPGKMQSYLAAGKPILGSANGEVADIIREACCGLCAPAEDSIAFADIVRAFVASDHKHIMGRNARTYYNEHFEQAYVIDTIEARLQNLAKRQS